MKVHPFVRQLVHALFRRRNIVQSAAILGMAGIALSSPRHSLAGPAASASASLSEGDTHYGLFGWLDRRSEYGKGVFPEPFLVDDSDLEEGEARLDWLRTANGSLHRNLFSAELEQGFGVVTLEIKVPFERISERGQITQGTDNVAIGARAPIWQYVSRDGAVDDTFGVSLEVGIPTHSALSKNAEIVPALLNDLKLGNFTLQSFLGYSMMRGPGDAGGLDTFEYGFTFGYTIPHKTIPLPGVQQLIPVVELSGGTPLNKADSGRSSLLAEVGFRVNLNAIGRVQPRLGFGVVLPLDNGARDDAHWGLVTSLAFDY
jgi:hypothetical protein